MRGIASEPTTDWPLPSRPQSPTTRPELRFDFSSRSPGPSDVVVCVNLKHEWSGELGEVIQQRSCCQVLIAGDRYFGYLILMEMALSKTGSCRYVCSVVCGLLTVLAAQNTLQSLGKERSQQELDRMIRYMNNNGDGKVNFEEFCEVMTNQKEVLTYPLHLLHFVLHSLCHYLQLLSLAN